jgi:hypothetical protein
MGRIYRRMGVFSRWQRVPCYDASAGDKGIDVAGFCDEDRWRAFWDNYQCKCYLKPLGFSDVLQKLVKLCSIHFAELPRRKGLSIYCTGKGARLDLGAVKHAPNLRPRFLKVGRDDIYKITDTQRLVGRRFFWPTSMLRFSDFGPSRLLGLGATSRNTRFYNGRFGGRPSRLVQSQNHHRGYRLTKDIRCLLEGICSIILALRP